MKKYKIAYFGSPNFAADFLEDILSDGAAPLKVHVVITQPDRPVGKKQILTQSPVKRTALEHHIPVLETIDDQLETVIKNCDFAIVFAYGNLLPAHLLGKTKITFVNSHSGFINIHFSLLPLYRGAAPTAYTLALGDKKTGVSFCIMNEKMDQGPLLVREETAILPEETRNKLDVRLTNLSYDLLKRLLAGRFEKHPLIKQDSDFVSYAPLLKKQDGYIPFVVIQKALNNEPLDFNELPKIVLDYINKYPWSMKNRHAERDPASPGKLEIGNTSEIIYDYFRGLYPWPGIWTIIQPAGLKMGQQKRLRITEMTRKNNHLIITKVQLEGKNKVDFNTFQKAYRIF